jgi:putative redox protein
MYAERKRMVMEDLQIVLSHRAVSTKAKKGLVTGQDEGDLIQARIFIAGEMKDADRERLMHVATRCWMHRTLSTGVRIQLSQGMAEDVPDGRKAQALQPF